MSSLRSIRLSPSVGQLLTTGAESTLLYCLRPVLPERQPMLRQAVLYLHGIAVRHSDSGSPLATRCNDQGHEDTEGDVSRSHRCLTRHGAM